MKKRVVAAMVAAVTVCGMMTVGCGKQADSVSGTKDAVTESESVEDADVKTTSTEDGDSSEDNDTGANQSAGDSALKGTISVSGTDFVVDDRVIFLNGVNTPWDNWNDLGGDFDEEFWESHFAELHENGVNASRVWISCNGDVGFTFDEDGYVTAVSDAYWEDLETLLTIADENGIYIMATIMSFDHFKDTNQTYENWRALCQDSDKIDSYVDNYVIPLCEKFDSHDSLFAIDLCNEPDWIHENAEDGKLDWSDLGNLFAREAQAIHTHSDILVTIGFGMSKYNSSKYDGNYGSDEYLQSCYDSEDAYLDFYSPHYYEWEAPWFNFPFDKTPEEFGMEADRPVVIGEFPASGMTSATEGSQELSGSECYLGLYENGWNGAFAWTSNGVDGCGSLKDFSEGVNAISEKE